MDRQRRLSLLINSPLRLVVAMSVLSIILLTIFYFVYHASQIHVIPSFLNDQVHYIGIARHLVDYGHVTIPGKFPSTGNIVYPSLLKFQDFRIYIPGYYTVLAGSFWLFGFSSFTAVLPNMLFFVCTVGLIIFACVKLYDLQVALFTSLMFIFMPSDLFYSLTAMSETTFTFICFLCFVILITIPKRWRSYSIPLLMALAYIFRQTSVFLLLPMLAYVYDTNSVRKFSQLIFIALASIITLKLVNVWQVHNGMCSMPFADFLKYGHVSYNNAYSEPNAVLSLREWYTLLFQHISENINIILSTLKKNTTLPKLTTPTFYIGTMMTIVVFVYGIFKRKQTLLPLSISFMVMCMFGLCVGLYNGNPVVISRLCMYTIPFLSMSIAAMCYDSAVSGYLFFKLIQRYRWMLILILVALTLIGNIHAAKHLRKDEMFTNDAVAFFDSTHFDPHQLVVAPCYIAPGFLYRDYPTLYSFIPENDKTLILLNMKYPIGTMLLNEADKYYSLSDKAIKQIGLSLVEVRMFYRSRWYIYKRQSKHT